MPKITQFTKENLPAIRKAMNEALAILEKDFGVKIEVNGITYNANNFGAKITAIIADAVSDPYLQGVNAKNIAELTKCREFKDALLRRVTINRTTYVVVGHHGRSGLIVRQDGTPEGKLGVFKYEYGDKLYCQAAGIEYSEENDFSRINMR